MKSAVKLLLMMSGAISPPGAVTNLAITGASGGTVPDLTPEATWDAVAGALYYEVEIATTGNLTGTPDDTPVNDTSYTFATLIDSTSYDVGVRAVGAGGPGPWTTITVLVISPYHAAVLALNPDAWWRLDETSGTTAVDATGNGWDASFSAGVTVNQASAGANIGKSYDFNGSTNNLAVPYNAAWPFDYLEAFYICAWIYPQTYTVGTPRVFDINGSQIMYVQSTPQVAFQQNFEAGVTPGLNTGLTTNAWNFVAGVIDDDDMVTVYVANAANGWTVTAGTTVLGGTGARIQTTAPAGIGWRASDVGREFDGLIDEVVIGAGAPTLAQLQGVVDAAAPFDLGAGIWTWFSDPRALRVGDITYLGAVDGGGNAIAMQYDHLAESTKVFTLHATLGTDDHDGPALLVRDSDSKLMAFYSHHNGSEYYLRVSTNALDATAWGTEATLDASLGMDTYTYANPIQLTGETNDPIWLFFRGDPPGGDGWAQYYSKSEDDGATWAAATRWLANGGERPYIKVVQNGDARIDFAMTDGHPNSVATNSLYHGYYEGGNWYKSDGTLVGGVGDLPFVPSDFTKVYDGTTINCWVSDIVIDGSGNPVIVYDTFPSTTDHRYRYAKWSGAAWSDNEIVAAGTYLYAAEANYSGGISLDPADVNTVYLSRETGDADWEIWRYVTSDGGATWSGTKLTTESGRALRPFVVRGHGSDKKVAYFTGTYTSYTSFNTVIKLIDG